MYSNKFYYFLNPMLLFTNTGKIFGQNGKKFHKYILFTVTGFVAYSSYIKNNYFENPLYLKEFQRIIQKPFFEINFKNFSSNIYFYFLKNLFFISYNRSIIQSNPIRCDQSLSFPSYSQLYTVPSKPRTEKKHFGNLSIYIAQINANSPLEDRYCISCINNNNKDNLIAAVIDGHGGWWAAEFIANNLVQYLYNTIINNNELKDSDIIDTFKLLDNALENFLKNHSKNSYLKGGACCLTLLINENTITAINVGDCMAVLSRQNEIVKMNHVHNANDPFEQKLIIEAHPDEKDAVLCRRSWVEPIIPKTLIDKTYNFFGVLGSETFYSGCYVKNSLNPTRSFGDFALKYEKYAYDQIKNRHVISKPFSFPYISVTPAITKFTRNSTDEFIIIGSDGLWDFLDPQEAVGIVKMNYSSLENAAQKLIDTVFDKCVKKSGFSKEELLKRNDKRKFFDDLTVCIIDLKSKPDSTKK